MHVGVCYVFFMIYMLNNNTLMTILQYYSIGGERLPAHGSEMLKYTNSYILNNKDKNAPADNDGLFIQEEIQWGHHLINFEADHAELIGLG